MVKGDCFFFRCTQEVSRGYRTNVSVNQRLSVSFQNNLFTLKRRRQVHTLHIYRRFRSYVFLDKYINKIIRLEWNGNCFVTPNNGYNWAKHIFFLTQDYKEILIVMKVLLINERKMMKIIVTQT